MLLSDIVILAAASATDRFTLRPYERHWTPHVQPRSTFYARRYRVSLHLLRTNATRCLFTACDAPLAAMVERLREATGEKISKLNGVWRRKPAQDRVSTTQSTCARCMTGMNDGHVTRPRDATIWLAVLTDTCTAENQISDGKRTRQYIISNHLVSLSISLDLRMYRHSQFLTDMPYH